MTDTLETNISPLNESDYENFFGAAVKSMIDGLTESGALRDVLLAKQFAEEYFSHLLDAGIHTPNSFFFSIESSGSKVGYVWYYVRFVEDRTFARLGLIYIDEKYRRRGYARRAIKCVEQKLHGLGWNSVELNVFSGNHPAIKLYQDLGYVVKDDLTTRFLMEKQLRAQADTA